MAAISTLAASYYRHAAKDLLSTAWSRAPGPIFSVAYEKLLAIGVTCNNLRKPTCSTLCRAVRCRSMEQMVVLSRWD